MDEKNQKIDVFNESFLCASLNAYEGNSKYFRQINAHFAALLTAYYKHFNEAKADWLIEKIKKERAYKNHPFIPFFLKYFAGEKITSRTKEHLLEALRAYPDYPLAAYFTAIVSPLYGMGSDKGDDNFLLFINHMNSTTINLDSLNILSARGFALATISLLLASLKAGDIKKIETLLPLAVAQNGGETKTTTVVFLEKLLILAPVNAEIKETVYHILVKNGANEYILPLVDLYEKSKNKLSAFFTLHLANALNIKGAALRLLAYYERGENIPTNEEIIKYLKNNLD